MSRPTGTVIRSPSGCAPFVRDPLPAALTWSPTLIRVLSDADRLAPNIQKSQPRHPGETGAAGRRAIMPGYEAGIQLRAP